MANEINCHPAPQVCRFLRAQLFKGILVDVVPEHIDPNKDEDVMMCIEDFKTCSHAA